MADAGRLRLMRPGTRLANAVDVIGSRWDRDTFVAGVVGLRSWGSAQTLASLERRRQVFRWQRVSFRLGLPNSRSHP